MISLDRIIAVYVGELIVIIIHGSVLYKIIKRKNRTKSSMLLSLFFISVMIGFLLNLVYLPIQINPFAYILYMISAFFILISNLYLTLALWVLHSDLNLRHIIFLNLLYGIVIVLILSIPNGIRYDQTTDWAPDYSWEFLIATYLYLVIGGILPLTYFLIRILKRLPSFQLKKRIWIFSLGELLYFTDIIGLTLYNTWDNQIFRSLWLIIGLIFVILFAVFIYFGLGKELKE